MNTGKILIGLGGLVVGLAAGCFIPRGDVQISAPAPSRSRTAAVTNSARSAAERAESRKNEVAKKLIQSIPASDDYSGRDKWLENLATGDLAALMDSLCAGIGPDGLEYSDKALLEKALKKWWAQDREGALAWVANLPARSTKRYFMKNLLAALLKDDSARALSLSAAFQAEDPTWNHVGFHDQYIELLINGAWKKPGASAEEMLDFYSQLSRGNGSTGSPLGKYPENFEFQKFLDGIVSQNEKDKKRPSGMPSDVLEGWAKVNPSAAAQWFLESTEKKTDVSFQDWEDISKAVSEKNGPQAYYEWAADIISEATAGQRKVILESMADQDAMGIVSSLDDIGLRDQILGAMARKNSGTLGKDDQTIDFLAKISTPEARLRILKENDSQFEWWMKKYPPDASSWQKLGLTQEQVSAALAEKH